MSGTLSGITAIPGVQAALGGMQRAQSLADAAGADLARGGGAATDGAAGAPDVAGDMVTLSMAQVQMAASVQVERTAVQMQKTLLDLLA